MKKIETGMDPMDGLGKRNEAVVGEEGAEGRK